MNRKTRLVLALAFAILVAVAITVRDPTTTAQAQSPIWTITCKGVATADRGLWFDSAGPGANNEGAFFWIRNRTNGDESCTASVKIIPGVSTDKFSTLRVRAAVNDGARFSVQALKLNASGSACSEVAAYVVWNENNDNNEFVVKTVEFTEKTRICMISMTLTDEPNEIRTLRTNALVDEIRIWDGATTGWMESFTVTPP
jgi:hypothetical protein